MSRVASRAQAKEEIIDNFEVLCRRKVVEPARVAR